MKRVGKRRGGQEPPAFPFRGQLIPWADRLFGLERSAIKPRIGVVRAGVIEAIDVGPIVDAHGIDALFQSGAVLARTAGEEEPVFVFLKAYLSGDMPGGVTTKRSGFADGFAACLLARTKTGLKLARYWQTEAIARGTLRTVSADSSEKSFDGYPDWMESDFWIDPALEDVLARANVPGAVRQVRPRPASATPLVFAAAHTARKAPLPPPPPPPLPEPTEPTEPPLEFPWEAARAESVRLHALGGGDLGRSAFATIPSALPVGLDHRDLDDLVRNGWTSEAQACQLARRVNRSSTAAATLETLLSGHLPPVATMFASAVAADVGYQARDLSLMRYAASELRARVDAATTAAGGLRSWLDTAWPTEVTFAGMLGTVTISCAANDSFWRIWLPMTAPLELPLTPDSAMAKALAHAAAVRDWILDRAGVAADAPGERVAALARKVLHAVPSADGEPRLEHWKSAVRERHENQVPELELRDHASVHAALLHAAIVITELRLARCMALAGEEVDRWRPEHVSTRGLLTHALDVVARHVLHRAARSADVDEQLRLLERARAIAPWDDAIARSFNEARFRAERWDERLLDDLWKEANATGAIAPIAEAHAVAVELGKQDVARSARRRLVAAAAGGPHAWIAAARVIFARPAELAKPESIREVEALPRPTGLDPEDRAVRALYGADPSAAVAELAAALVAQRELVEYAALEREDARRGAPDDADGARRPDAPVRPGDDAVARACAALSARVDLPRLATTELRRAVEAHAARSLELTSSEAEPTVAAWLEAVRGFVAAADAELARARDAAIDEAGLLAVFELADAALDAALVVTWAAAVLRQIATLRPVIPRVGARARELGRRTAALEAAAGAATTREARQIVDDQVLALLADAALLSTDLVDDDEPETPSAASPGAPDPFRPMVASSEVLERSRRELDTPGWAIVEALHQVTQFNLARGRRDLKLLKGTRESGTPLWELRHYDRRSGVRVLFVRSSDGPRVCAVMAKVDDAQQGRVIERVKGWLAAAV